MLFQATQEDIDTCLPRSPGGCLYARILQRVLGIDHVYVRYEGVFIRGYKQYPIPLPVGWRTVMVLIDQDRRREVIPHEFTLELKRELFTGEAPSGLS